MSTQDDDALELAVESALAEYLMRCDAGTAPDREQFLAKNSGMRERLEALLEAADWIEHLAGPTVGAASSATVVGGVPSLDPPLSSDSSQVTALFETGFPAAGQASVANSVSDSQALTLPVGSTSLVPSFSLGSLTPAQELVMRALPCRFGEYILDTVLGRGGMGVVYAGRQVHLERAVAIKMIRSGALASHEEVQRFYAEARSAARLDHPNIVTVYQCGEHDGHHFFSMDLVAGTDLAKLIQDGPMEGRRAARYVRDVARAIQFAHDRGILHRDLKPANVLVDENDQVHVTDFGLAKTVGHDTGLTATGAALGTPSYMSPEQAAGRTDEHDNRTDVYSLGAVLFALVTGKPPFHATTVVQTIMQVLHRPAPLARSVHAGVPADLETIIAKCLHKSPDRRYETAQELAEDLDRYMREEPIKARPLSPMRRGLYWAMGIPIVGALIGKRVIEPSAAHTWTQRGILAALMILGLFLVTRQPFNFEPSQRLPQTVRFAAGQAGGSYDYVSRVICGQLQKLLSLPTQPEVTEGSLDNRQRLIARQVDLALLQASTVKSEQIAVIAPLYYEAVHVVVRAKRGWQSIHDLRGQNVIVGPEGSGSRSVARRILQKHAMELTDITVVNTDWLSLDKQPDVDAAVVVVQVGNSRMHELLSSGEFLLLALDDAVQFSLDEPAFRLLPITVEYYPQAQLPAGGVNSIATTAYLTARVDCPDRLVKKVLEAIYTPEVQAACKLLGPEKVANWDVSWHRAAKTFYETYRER